MARTFIYIQFLATVISTVFAYNPIISEQKLASCYNSKGLPQRCIPEFENAAYKVQMEATNTCGDNGPTQYCIQTSTRSCEWCQPGDFSSTYLTDLHHNQENQTWWQSETMKESPPHQLHRQVNLTLHLGKAYDITYIRLVFYSPRPQSFALYKKTNEASNWEPYQYFSASCRESYGVNEQKAAEMGAAETHALCTSEYSDISPLTGGDVLFSTLEGRPSAYTFDNSPQLQEWVTATDLLITLDRHNTFGEEIFYDPAVLQTYWYAIADVAVGARCKCNGHASACETVATPDGRNTRACKCEHNTAGRDCERCLDFYNDAPWGRASSTNVHECKPCNCNGFSNKCFFDKELYELTGHGGHCLDCAENRAGPHCERCRENFYQGPQDYCLPCNCDPIGSRSLQCNAEGKCQCKSGVTGDKCDVCAPNHYAFSAAGCKSCDCDVAGSLDNTPHCHPDTGACVCKHNVEGTQCRACKPGFFNLDIANNFGCTPCFCFGHSSTCESAPKYQAHVSSSHFIRGTDKWTAQSDREQPAQLLFNANTQNIEVKTQSSETLYFVAPPQFLGDQRASYNHDMKFTLRLGEEHGYPTTQDIILEAAYATITASMYAQGNPEPTNQPQEYTFRLHEDPRYGWSPTLDTFEFMSVLQNLTAIKIRGTYNHGGQGYLINFKLETAKEGREKGFSPANWVEKCSCPKEYVGANCEECAPGYRHSLANGGPYDRCVPCNCNGHAPICDTATGFCICKHNTTGSNCELCAKGFYGNAIAGTPEDCQPCPCPKGSGCIQLVDKSIVCTDCPVGYAGPKCEVCADGYAGDPTGRWGEPRECAECQCSGNVDPNAVGNCNRTTGQCLKCIYNTAGDRCDKCLPGYFGDALDVEKKGDCQPCQCHAAGTLSGGEHQPACDGLTGICACAPHVVGRHCDACEDGYYDINSGEGCKRCGCNPEGSYNATCDSVTGQCYCKPGIAGKQCNQCREFHYGFSALGCEDCDCDEWGSTNYQCGLDGQCSCQSFVEGRRCDRCMENKKRRDDGQGCEECPPCYSLVQTAVQEHRARLAELSDIVSNIAKAPTVVESADFDRQLRGAREEIERLRADAGRSALGAAPLADRLAALTARVNELKNTLKKIEEWNSASADALSRSTGNVSKAEDTIEAAQKEINSALEYLEGEGAAALAKARNRSEQFGKQSVDMSALAKDSRLLADKLENDARHISEIASKAYNTSVDAGKMAKDGINKLANISSEVQTLSTELNAASGTLGYMSEQAEQALRRARTVYDQALDLYAQVNSTMLPDIRIVELKDKAKEINQTLEKMNEDLNSLNLTHEDTLSDLQKDIDHAHNLLDEGMKRQTEINEMLARLEGFYEQASNDVQLSTSTLADARAIYDTLKKFSDEVSSSRAAAAEAKLEAPVVSARAAAAAAALSGLEERLHAAAQRARHAGGVAHHAHHDLAANATQAAYAIKEKANSARVEANKLLDEAEKLSARVKSTASQIEQLESQANDNLQLTHDAKTKVAQANTDASEADKQVAKGLEDLKVIEDELNHLPTLDDNVLDNLEKSLNEAERDIRAADLEGKIKMLSEAKNNHQRWVKQYKDEAARLRDEVANVQDILKQLPEGCFKPGNLEPI